MAYIKILKGINAEKIIPLHQEMSLGRGVDSSICLPDPRVSRRHARISQHVTHFVIEDLRSSNGTLLRDSRLFPGTLYSLHHGDKITIGSTLMVFIDEPLESKLTKIKLVKTDISENELIKQRLREVDYSQIEPSSLSKYEYQNGGERDTQAKLHLWSGQQRTQTLPLRIVADDDSLPVIAASMVAATHTTKMEECGNQTKNLHDTVKRLQTICQVSMALGAIKEQDQLMQKIIDCIFDIFPAANRSFILLLESGSDIFKSVISKNRFPSYCNNNDFVVSKTIIDLVITQKRSILSMDAMNDERLNHQESVINLGIQSMMCVPLLVGEELVGIIQVDNDKNQQQFSFEDLQVLTGIGAQAAIAVKNAQLYEQVETETARRTSLQRYFSSSLVKMIMSDDVTTALGGNSYRGTILFADIIGFTKMSEATAPSDVLAKLNRFLTFMQKLIHQNGGNIDKVNGDSLMAFWGVPQTGAMDESNAVFTALQMQKHLWPFNLELKNEKQQPIYMGIGLNTGEFIAGNIGSDDKIEFTLIGDNVNLASRIEHLSGRNQVLISETTWRPIKHLVSAVQLPPLLVRGKSTPITIYSIRSMQSSQDSSYIMALPCHLLNETGLHIGSGIITGFTPSNSGIYLHLSTSIPLKCRDYITLQMQTFEYHKPFLCNVQVDNALTGMHGGICVYTKLLLKCIDTIDEEDKLFFKPGSCFPTTYTWNDLKRR